MTEWFTSLFQAKLTIGSGQLYWREIIGNAFGLASAILGMRRKVWAWPVGILGNLLLLTVFVSSVFHLPDSRADLWGQAARQVFFLIVSVYGWYRWARYQRHHPEEGVAVQPRWATTRERLLLAAAGLVIFLISWPILVALHSYGPKADAWIFTGSLLATYAMARGWTEFWLIWLAVDAVGVPLLLAAGYYPSAVMYLVYAAFVIWGFFTWWRIQRRAGSGAATS